MRTVKLYTAIVFLVLSASVFASYSAGDTSRLELLFAGDLMGHDDQIIAAWDKASGKYSYDTCFSWIRDYVKSADIAFLNLEVTLAGPPYKGYPRFSSPDELALAALNAGFDVYLTANNHMLDNGKRGLERTIDVLNRMSIIHTGTFTDPESREKYYPLIIEKNNIRLAVLNYTYGTNGIKVTEPNIVNYIDTSLIVGDLEKAKLAEPDFIIVVMHWGEEYENRENMEQRKMADFIFSKGADVIIGSHPHVIQPVRKYKSSIRDESVDRIIVYSLGNFLSNQRSRYRNGGLIFKLSLQKTDKTRVAGFETYPVYVHKEYYENKPSLFVLLPVQNFDFLTEFYKMNSADKERFRIFKEDTEEILNIFD